jgi:hypothetical protein
MQYRMGFLFDGRRGLVVLLLAAVASTGCRAAPVRRTGVSGSTARRFDPSPTTPVITTATVVAFWLGAADTLSADLSREARADFKRSNQAVAEYLGDTDIALVATVSDTVVVQLERGPRRLVMLSGLDFPYGYLLVEPGYAEEFHTGITADQDLEDAIDNYFGLNDDGPAPAPKHRIASAGLRPQRPPVQPGPRTIIPGLAPVCWPSLTTSVPFTKTYLIPTDTWWGCSKVARSATVSGSKITRSA